MSIGTNIRSLREERKYTQEQVADALGVSSQAVSSWGLSRTRICRMIRETEEYYPKLLKSIKATPEYNNAAWLLQYQIESMLDIYKRLM